MAEINIKDKMNDNGVKDFYYNALHT